MMPHQSQLGKVEVQYLYVFRTNYGHPSEIHQHVTQEHGAKLKKLHHFVHCLSAVNSTWAVRTLVKVLSKRTDFSFFRGVAGAEKLTRVDCCHIFEFYSFWHIRWTEWCTELKRKEVNLWKLACEAVNGSKQVIW